MRRMQLMSHKQGTKNAKRQGGWTQHRGCTEKECRSSLSICDRAFSPTSAGGKELWIQECQPAHSSLHITRELLCSLQLNLNTGPSPATRKGEQYERVPFPYIPQPHAGLSNARLRSRREAASPARDSLPVFASPRNSRTKEKKVSVPPLSYIQVWHHCAAYKQCHKSGSHFMQVGKYDRFTTGIWSGARNLTLKLLRCESLSHAFIRHKGDNFIQVPSDDWPLTTHFLVTPAFCASA